MRAYVSITLQLLVLVYHILNVIRIIPSIIKLRFSSYIKANFGPVLSAAQADLMEAFLITFYNPAHKFQLYPGVRSFSTPALYWSSSRWPWGG